MPETTELGADVVAHTAFRTTFRGYDQREVRVHLRQVAAALASAEGRARSLAEQLAAVEAQPAPVELDEEQLEAALGAHAATVLHAARRAAADLRAAAEREVAERRAAIDAEVEATVAAAAERARAILAEAHAEREAVVRDLARRQRAAHQQLAQLRADRVELLGALATARSVADEAVERLTAAADDEPSARRRRRRDAPPPSDSTQAAPAGRGVDAEVPPAATDGASPDGAAVARVADAAAEATASADGTPPACVDSTEAIATGAEVVDPAASDTAAAVTEEPSATGGDTPVAAAAATAGAPAADTAAVDAPSAGDEGAAAGAPPPVPRSPSTADRPAVTAPSSGTPAGVGVDDVLTRLREDRAATLAQAAAVLTDIAVRPLEPRPGAAHPRAPVAAPTLSTAPPRTGAEPATAEAAVSLFERRDGEVEVHEQALVRALKRALVDEQNWLLDALRRARGAPDVDRVMDPPAERSRRFADVSEPFLVAAAAAGALAPPWGGVVPSCPDRTGPGAPPQDSRAAVRAVAVALGSELVAGLASRLASSTVVDGASEDEAAVGEAVSTAYRECRAERVQPLARHAVSAAWGAGAFAAAPDGHLSWLVDPADRCSADCEDNALAGPTPKGQPFPTGDRHPPAHPGCRCLLVPASR